MDQVDHGRAFMARAEVADAVTYAVLKVLRVPAAWITESADLTADLAASPAERARLIDELHERFAGAVPTCQLAQAQTIGDLVAMIAGALAGPAEAHGRGLTAETAA